MGARRLLFLVFATFPLVATFGSSKAPFAPAPALAWTSSPTPPTMFPPPGSTVPANTEVRVDVEPKYGRLTARTAPSGAALALTARGIDRAVDATDVPRSGAMIAARPKVLPKPGARITFSLESVGGVRLFGEGQLGTLTWTAKEDVTAPTLRVEKLERVEARSASGPSGASGRIAGAPDRLRLKLHIEDESPVAVLYDVVRDAVPEEDAGHLMIPTRSEAGLSVEIPFNRPADGLRLALRAIDAAGHHSPWRLTDPIPRASDEDRAFAVALPPPPPSGVPASAVTPERKPGEQKPRGGCGR